MIYKYRNVPRIGDHICYISDLRKIKKNYPKWEIKGEIFNPHGQKLFLDNFYLDLYRRK